MRWERQIARDNSICYISHRCFWTHNIDKGVQLKLRRKENNKRCELDSYTTGGVPLGWISITWQQGTCGSTKCTTFLYNLCVFQFPKNNRLDNRDTWIALLLRSPKVPNSNLSPERLQSAPSRFSYLSSGT